jgi:DNA repair exonuclease SbcCD ATPase subunit
MNEAPPDSKLDLDFPAPERLGSAEQSPGPQVAVPAPPGSDGANLALPVIDAPSPAATTVTRPERGPEQELRRPEMRLPEMQTESASELRNRIQVLEDVRQREREVLELAATKAEERLRASDLAHEDHKRQISDLAGQVSALDLAARRVEKDLDDTRCDLAASERGRSELARRVEELSSERDNLRRALEEADEERRHLDETRAQLEEIKKIRNELREEVASLWERIEGKDRELRNIKAQLAETEDAYREERSNLQSRAREGARAELDERIRELEDQLESRDAAWGDIEGLVRRSAEEKLAIENDLAARTRELQEKDKALKDKIIELEKLREEFQTSKARQSLEEMESQVSPEQKGDFTVAELRMELGEFDA